MLTTISLYLLSFSFTFIYLLFLISFVLTTPPIHIDSPRVTGGGGGPVFSPILPNDTPCTGIGASSEECSINKGQHGKESTILRLSTFHLTLIVSFFTAMTDDGREFKCKASEELQSIDSGQGEKNRVEICTVVIKVGFQAASQKRDDFNGKRGDESIFIFPKLPIVTVNLLYFLRWAP
jgi:hypothetical protein